MEEGRDATKNVCGADYDMCRWLDFLCFWDTDNKPQALTSVVNYYPWKPPDGMRVDDKESDFYLHFHFFLFAPFNNFCNYACNVVAPLQNKLHKILTSISHLTFKVKWSEPVCNVYAAVIGTKVMCCPGSSFMQYGCFGENIASHVHLQLVGLIIHVSKPNFFFPKVKYSECIFNY